MKAVPVIPGRLSSMMGFEDGSKLGHIGIVKDRMPRELIKMVGLRSVTLFRCECHAGAELLQDPDGLGGIFPVRISKSKALSLQDPDAFRKIFFDGICVFRDQKAFLILHGGAFPVMEVKGVTVIGKDGAGGGKFLHAGVLDIFRGEGTVFRCDHTCDQEACRLKSVLLQNWICLGHVVFVSVVEGDDDALFWDLLFVYKEFMELRKGKGREAFFFQKRDLFLEFLLRDDHLVYLPVNHLPGREVALLYDAVIGEDRDRTVSSRTSRERPGFLRAGVDLDVAVCRCSRDRLRGKKLGEVEEDACKDAEKKGEEAGCEKALHHHARFTPLQPTVPVRSNLSHDWG